MKQISFARETVHCCIAISLDKRLHICGAIFGTRIRTGLDS